MEYHDWRKGHTKTAQYLSSIVQFFDHDKNGVISLEDYNKAHTHEFGIFGWYESHKKDSLEKEMNLTIKAANKHDTFIGIDQFLRKILIFMRMK